MRTIGLFSLILWVMLSSFEQKSGGIRGKVVWKAGNVMPGPDRPRASGQPVKREIHVYALTKMSEVNTVDAGGFYDSVRTRLIKKVVSNAQGRFRVSLPPGQYSVFVKEPKGLWANLSDGEMNINPVTVKAGQFSTLTLVVDYAAVY
ncbi:MAG: carboxypeptidase-like regulatory domain-containing protein [Cytophagaceae bacterium]|nr:carboxypeptidase-like regulatory domain-containing protein [Cytophagaceae bacterium]